MSATAPLRLRVQKIQSVCSFELIWGRGQTLTAMVPYPPELAQRYREWQRAYLSFYQSLQHVPPPVASQPEGLRGRAVTVGQVAPQTVNWQRQLVQAEAQLLHIFHHWLRSAELFEIRSTINQLRQQEGAQLDLFLTCAPTEVARLPWETLSDEFDRSFNPSAQTNGTAAAPDIHQLYNQVLVNRRQIRIARAPGNIRADSGPARRDRTRPRILAILGDDTGLDFAADQQAVQSLSRLAEVRFIGWQSDQTSAELKATICQTIADPKGWDILFFAGHSNEAAAIGGEIQLAPGVAIAMSELAPSLQTAKAQGLQFALFNSCSGLDIAESLIDLGLSQVAVMREPIHNLVAQSFLIQFLQALANHQDVHDALLLACYSLGQHDQFRYPSAHLVPSLFRHPASHLFQIRPKSWQQQVRRLVPRPWEAVALMLLVGLSWQLPVQSWLMQRRFLAQAAYRHVTQQVPQTQPPMLLVQIDNESIIDADIGDPHPIDRTYLAELIDQAASVNSRVVGLDYILDRPQGDADQVLADSLQRAVEQQDLWFVTGATKDDNGVWLPLDAERDRSSHTWYGDIRMWRSGLQFALVSPAPQPLSISHLMALSHQMRVESDATADELAAMTQTDQAAAVRERLTPKAAAHPLTLWSYQWRQLWLHPTADFSIPPTQVYERIAAWQFLDLSVEEFQQQYGQQTILIMPGGYEEAGVSAPGEDNYPLPAAVGYWRQRQTPADPRRQMPGGEIHAYNTYGLLHGNLITPIPDLWMVGLFLLLGKAIALQMEHYPASRRQWQRLTGLGLISYGWFSLQLYVSASIMLPWLLPSLALSLYVLPHLPLLNRKPYE